MIILFSVDIYSASFQVCKDFADNESDALQIISSAGTSNYDANTYFQTGSSGGNQWRGIAWLNDTWNMVSSDADVQWMTATFYSYNFIGSQNFEIYPMTQQIDKATVTWDNCGTGAGGCDGWYTANNNITLSHDTISLNSQFTIQIDPDWANTQVGIPEDTRDVWLIKGEETQDAGATAFRNSQDVNGPEVCVNWSIVLPDTLPPLLTDPNCYSCDPGTNTTHSPTPIIDVECTDEENDCSGVRIANITTLDYETAGSSRNCFEHEGNYRCVLNISDSFTRDNKGYILYFWANDTAGNYHTEYNLSISLTYESIPRSFLWKTNKNDPYPIANLSKTGLFHTNALCLNRSCISTWSELNNTPSINGSSINVTRIVGNGNNLVIGNASGYADSHYLISESDLYISGKLEVDGESYYDAGMTVTLNPGQDTTMIFKYGSAYTHAYAYYYDDGPKVAIKKLDYGNYNYIITSWDQKQQDHNHSIQSPDPTLFIHSETDPNIDNHQWISMTHNRTDGVIRTGTGHIYLEPESGVVWVNNNLTASDIIDLTPAYANTPKKALEEINRIGKITNSKGELEIDHSSLPPMSKRTVEYIDRSNCHSLCTNRTGKSSEYNIPPNFVNESDEDIVCQEFCDEEIKHIDGRSVSSMTTVMTEAIKELTSRIETLEFELCLYNDKYEWCK